MDKEETKQNVEKQQVVESKQSVVKNTSNVAGDALKGGTAKIERNEKPLAPKKDAYEEAFEKAGKGTEDIHVKNKKLKEQYKKSRKNLSLKEWAKLGVCSALDIDPDTEHLGEEIWQRVLNVARAMGLNSILEIGEAFRQLAKGEFSANVFWRTLKTIGKGILNGFLDIGRRWKESLLIAGAGLLNIFLPEDAPQLKSFGIKDLKEWAIEFFHLNTIKSIYEILKDDDNKYPGAKAKIKEIFLTILDRIGSQVLAALNPVEILKGLMGSVTENLFKGFPGGDLLFSMLKGLPSGITSMVQAVAAAMDGNYDIIANGLRVGILQGIGKVLGIVLTSIPQTKGIVEGIRAGIGLFRTATSFLDLDLSGLQDIIKNAKYIKNGISKDNDDDLPETARGMATVKEISGYNSVTEGVAGIKDGKVDVKGSLKGQVKTQLKVFDKDKWKNPDFTEVKKFDPSSAKGREELKKEAISASRDASGDGESIRNKNEDEQEGIFVSDKQEEEKFGDDNLFGTSFKNPLADIKNALHGEDSVLENAKSEGMEAVAEANKAIDKQLELENQAAAGKPEIIQANNDVAAKKKMKFKLVQAGEKLDAIVVPKAIRSKLSGNYARAKNAGKETEKNTLEEIGACHIMHFVLIQGTDAIYRTPVADNFKDAVECMQDDAIDELKGKNAVEAKKGDQKESKAKRKAAAKDFSAGKNSFLADLTTFSKAAEAEVELELEKKEQENHEKFVKQTQEAHKAYEKKIRQARKKVDVKKSDGKVVSLKSYEKDYEIAKKEFEKHTKALNDYKEVCSKLKEKDITRNKTIADLVVLESDFASKTGDDKIKEEKRRVSLMYAYNQLSDDIKELKHKRDSLRSEVSKFIHKMSDEEKELAEMKKTIDEHEEAVRGSVAAFSNEKAEKEYRENKAKSEQKVRGLDPAKKTAEASEMQDELDKRLAALKLIADVEDKELNEGAKLVKSKKKQSKSAKKQSKSAKKDDKAKSAKLKSKSRERADKIEAKRGAILTKGQEILNMKYTSEAVFKAVNERLKKEERTILDVAVEEVVGPKTSAVQVL